LIQFCHLKWNLGLDDTLDAQPVYMLSVAPQYSAKWSKHQCLCMNLPNTIQMAKQQTLHGIKSIGWLEMIRRT